MAVRTEEEAEDAIYAAMHWRRTELATLRAEVARVRPEDRDAPRGRMLLRASVVLSYSHWEGFVKQVCQVYVDFVTRRRLHYADMGDALVRTAIRQVATRIPNDNESLSHLVDVVRKGGAERARLSRRGTVDTKSNLRFDAFEALTNDVGIDVRSLSGRRHFIDARLCDSRNTIAHGEFMTPSVELALELHDGVIALMETVQGKVLDAIRNRHYRDAAGDAPYL